MRRNLAAYTSTTYKTYPDYISINTEEDGRVSIAVRANEGVDYVTIFLSEADARKLGDDLRNGL